MVEQRQARGPGRAREIGGQLGRSVAPRQLGRLLLECVLRVVDQQVGVGEELDVPIVFAVHARELRVAVPLGMVR